MATFTPDTEYYITIEDQEKMIQAINKGSLKNANRDFHIWGIERSGFFNGREKWAKGFENQRV